MKRLLGHSSEWRVALVGLVTMILLVGCGESTSSTGNFTIITGLSRPLASTGQPSSVYVFNDGATDLTNVRITLDGSYQYKKAVATLPGKAKAPDNRIAVRFRDCLDGKGKSHGGAASGVSSVTIECDQGRWKGPLTELSVFQKRAEEWRKSLSGGAAGAEQEDEK